jgi:23S rRNA maturation mini-RNase III
MQETIFMAGLGHYIADIMEGITRVEDLSKPKIVRRSRNYKHRRCPRCEHSTYRLRWYYEGRSVNEHYL